MSKYLDFFPYSVPTYDNMISLPQESTEYETVTIEDEKMIEREKTVEINIDLSRLTVKKDKQKIAYSVKELKDIARYLGIKGAGTMNKENLVKYIKLKIKK